MSASSLVPVDKGVIRGFREAEAVQERSFSATLTRKIYFFPNWQKSGCDYAKSPSRSAAGGGLSPGGCGPRTGASTENNARPRIYRAHLHACYAEYFLDLV